MVVRYQTILVGMDLTPLSTLGLNAAVAVAARVGASRLHVAHVVPVSPAYLPTGTMLPFPFASSVVEPVLLRTVADARERIEALPIAVPPGASFQVTRDAHLGIPAKELCRIAESISADLIVVASRHRSGLARLVLGSVADALIRAAHCPVLVVGEGHPGDQPPKRVLASIDLSPISEKVVAHAAQMAISGGGALKVVSLLEIPLAAPGLPEPLPVFLKPAEVAEMVAVQRRTVAELVDRVKPPGLEVAIEVRSASPLDAVLETAKDDGSDLIVLGTSGHNAWQRMLLGSTANKVLAHAESPVLVVPHLSDKS